MKRRPIAHASVLVLCAVLAITVSGCRRKQVLTVVSAPTAQGTEPVPAASAPFSQAAPESAAVPAESAPAAETQPAPDETSAAVPETTAAAPAPAYEAVTLPIELPAANGEMQGSRDPANPLIRAVAEARGLDPARLAAVFSVPASGQNYVFEFFSAENRTADGLRRVYLLSDNGDIRSVAASDAAEREGISAAENWFCMNVLIKNVVFPAVQEKIR